MNRKYFTIKFTGKMTIFGNSFSDQRKAEDCNKQHHIAQ